MTSKEGRSRCIWLVVFLMIISSTLLSGCARNELTPISALESTVTAGPSRTAVPFPTEPVTITSTPEAKLALLDESTSPSGEWTAVATLTTTEKARDLLFVVSNNETAKEWIVEQVNLNELQTPMPGLLYPSIFKWSEDENYLYYSYLSTFNDGCYGYFEPGGLGLKRFDLSTGNVIPVLQGWVTWMSLSPDEQRLAYIDSFGGRVSVMDVKTGNAQMYELPAVKNESGLTTDTSDLYWSPDGASLIYAHYTGACDLSVPYSYVIRLYPDTGQQKILVENSEKGYIPIGWETQDKIQLRNIDGELWWLDPATLEITPIQP